MFELPFLVGPGVEEEGIRYITEAGYIKGSFVYVKNIDELNLILSGADRYAPKDDTQPEDGQEVETTGEETEAREVFAPGFALESGTPIYVGSLGRIFKYQQGVTDYAELKSFDFLRDNLELDRLYVWSNDGWVDKTDLINNAASEAQIAEINKAIESLRKAQTETQNALNKEVADREVGDLHLQATLQAEVRKLNTAIGDLGTSLTAEIDRAEKEEQRLDSKIAAVEAGLTGNFTQLRNEFQENKADVSTSLNGLHSDLEALAGEVSDHHVSYTTQFNALNQGLADEVARAKGAEEELSSDLAETRKNLDRAKKDLQQSLITEMQIRAAQDQALASSINTTNSNLEQEVKDRMAAVANEEAERKQSEGNLEDLTTDAKDSLVNAINEVDGHADTNTTNIGDMELLTPSSHDTVVHAINDVDARAKTNTTNIGALADGTLGNLTTENKDNLVSAINEVVTNLGKEQTRATEAEEALDTAIKAETTRAKSVEGELTSLNDGLSQDNLVVAINSENTRAKAEEAEIAQGLSDETARAEGVEGSLGDLTTTAKGNLVAAINSEVARAKAAEQAEETRAATAEGELNTAIQNEQERAETAEQDINDRIGDGFTAEETVAKKVAENKTAIEAEVTRATDAESALSGRVTTIENKIPAQASATNQLADKAFVNSSIAANAARFITPSAKGDTLWDSLDALKVGPWFYEGQSISVCENNDYATYLVAGEEGKESQQWRAIFQKSQPAGQVGGEWVGAYSYNTVWTAEQRAAIDSGITEELVGQITTNKNDIAGIETKNTEQDTAIAGVKSTADTNKTNIGTLSGLTTTTKTNLVAAINEVASTAKTNSDTVQKNLDAEITRAKAAEQANTDAITAEEARATAAEKKNADAIAAEATTARAAEKTNADAIAAETTRAKGVEATNAGNITKNADAIAALQGTVTTQGELIQGASDAAAAAQKSASGAQTAADTAAQSATAAQEAANKALPLAGGTMTGPIKFANTTACPANTSPTLFLTSTATTNGTLGHVTVANAKTVLGVTAVETAVQTAQAAAEKAQTTADGKYTLPAGGIPKTTLASAVQTSLGLADTAVQPSDLADVATSGKYSDLTGTPTIPTTLPPSGNAGGDLTGTYPNPTIAAGKITKAKCDSTVQASLTAADNAMPKAGGTFAGRVSWNETSLPAQDTAPYFVTIEAFASGGKTYYTSKENVKSDLGISTLEAGVVRHDIVQSLSAAAQQQARTNIGAGTPYTLPKATTTALGGVKLVNATVQTVAAATPTTTASRTYAVQFNSSDQLVVNVPWTNTTYSTASSTAGLVKFMSGTISASSGWTLASSTTDTQYGKFYANTSSIGSGNLISLRLVDSSYAEVLADNRRVSGTGAGASSSSTGSYLRIYSDSNSSTIYYYILYT